MIPLAEVGHMDKICDVDVAVVGGGIGGVYTAWRLLTSGSQRRARGLHGPKRAAA